MSIPFSNASLLLLSQSVAVTLGLACSGYGAWVGYLHWSGRTAAFTRLNDELSRSPGGMGRLAHVLRYCLWPILFGISFFYLAAFQGGVGCFFVPGEWPHQSGRHEVHDPQGGRYVGEFLFGRFSGEGELWTPDGVRAVGQFSSGQLESGSMHFPSGVIQEGEFWSWKLHGQGSVTGSDGEKITGYFINGEFQGSEVPKDLDVKAVFFVAGAFFLLLPMLAIVVLAIRLRRKRDQEVAIQRSIAAGEYDDARRMVRELVGVRSKSGGLSLLKAEVLQGLLLEAEYDWSGLEACGERILKSLSEEADPAVGDLLQRFGVWTGHVCPTRYYEASGLQFIGLAQLRTCRLEAAVSTLRRSLGCLHVSYQGGQRWDLGLRAKIERLIDEAEATDASKSGP